MRAAHLLRCRRRPCQSAAHCYRVLPGAPRSSARAGQTESWMRPGASRSSRIRLYWRAGSPGAGSLWRQANSYVELAMGGRGSFMKHGIDERKRWFALIVLCLGVLMIVLDTTVVNVALPSIRTDLGFTAASLSWVVHAYMLTFGGFLLLGGRLGDLYGHRRVFLLGTVFFALTSLGCGLATTQQWLVAARAVQGLGGAVMTAVALSLIVSLFSTPQDRARA